MKGTLSTTQERSLRLLEFFGKKWTLMILKCLQQMDACRFNQFEEDLDGISPKTLSERLKEFQELGLVDKEKYNEIPPRTEYVLTEKGEDLLDALECIDAWAEKWTLDDEDVSEPG